MTKREYDCALESIEHLMELSKLTDAQALRLDSLVAEVEAYENEHYPIRARDKGICPDCDKPMYQGNRGGHISWRCFDCKLYIQIDPFGGAEIVRERELYK